MPKKKTKKELKQELKQELKLRLVSGDNLNIGLSLTNNLEIHLSNNKTIVITNSSIQIKDKDVVVGTVNV